MTTPAFDNPWALLFVLFSVLPFIRFGATTQQVGTVDLLPVDRFSTRLIWLVKLLSSIAIVVAVLGIAGLNKPAHSVSRVGTGAHVVLLIDRSRSMDQPFATVRNAMTGVGGLAADRHDSKGSISRRVLSDFVDKRQNDMFGMVAFSTFPIPVLPLTDKQDIVQAAIQSGEIGRGLSQTNMSAGLERAMDYFINKPYTGSRIVLLVSDGAAHIDGVTRRRLAELLEASRSSLYWVYIRSRNGPEIFGEQKDHSPERSLHDFFSSTGSPYRAYTAESASDLKRAIEDVSRLQNLPLHFDEVVPRLPLERYCFALAALCLLPLLFARLTEVQRW